MKKILFTLIILAISMVALAQWSNNPEENNRITPLATEIYDHELKVAGNGTSFVVFNRPFGGNIATFLQIIDVNGNMLFSDQGKLISNKHTWSFTMAGELLFVDDDGNALVVVADCRNSAADDMSYTLYKVSQTGEMLWGENGVDLCGGMAYGLVACMKIIQLEDGSYVCAWEVEGTTTVYIQLQRISKTGELLWNEAVTRLYSASTFYEYPYLVNAGNNQALVVFSKGMMYNKTIKAQKFDSNGAQLWANEMNVYSGGFGMTPLWVVVRVISDQMGGAFVGWFDDRNYTNVESTYVAHIMTNGTHGFASGDNGEKIGYSPLRSFVPEMYFDSSKGFLYVTWRETNDTQSWQQMKGQKINVSTAELMWGANGIDVSPLTQNHSVAFHSIQNGGEGNVAIFFTSNTWHPEHAYGWDINNSTLINSNGEYVWEEEIIQFSTPVGFKGNMVSTPLISNNYWLTAWNDDRKIEGDPSGSRKIYMQRIMINGALGGATCFPPTNIVVEPFVPDKALVYWSGNADNYEISYRMIGGQWKNVIVPKEPNAFLLENLLPATNYEIRMRSICSEENISEWSAIIPFTTPEYPPCDPPVNLTATEVTATSALLSWEDGEEGIGVWYDVHFKNTAVSYWLGTGGFAKTILLDDLTPNSAYIWTVRTHCFDELIEELTSPWAPLGNFTTLPLGIHDSGKEQMNVYASGKMLNIINPEKKYIENVQLFDITGRLISEYKINSYENVLIPTNLSSTMMVFVRITMENGIENHKIIIP